MWLYCSGADSPDAALPNVNNIALYDYQNSRARACPVAFLGDYSGYLQTDAYDAYDGLHHVTNVGSLAHARRKFVDAKKLQGKGKSGKADKALAKIQKLYGSNKKWKKRYRYHKRSLSETDMYRVKQLLSGELSLRNKCSG